MNNPLAQIACAIVEEHFGTGEYKRDWKQGEEPGKQWTTIECSQCKGQLYFDTVMLRHRCSKCGCGF